MKQSSTPIHLNINIIKVKCDLLFGSDSSRIKWVPIHPSVHEQQIPLVPIKTNTIPIKTIISKYCDDV